MASLTQSQSNFIATINSGPDALDPALFAGPIDRVLLGLKTHANTISHARLAALEASFPRLMQHLGAENFNALSRAYIDTESARALDSNGIGQQFPAFLRLSDYPAQACELAQIEWAWLESYHAAEAMPYSLEQLAGLLEAELLEQPVGWHPATRLVPTHAPIAPALAELSQSRAAAVLIVRPDAEVRLLALDSATALLATHAQNITTIGNLLELSAEQVDEADPVGPVLTLIGAGALVAVE